MSKMKVHELAKELGVKSSDILEILKNKGIEVKSHMSVLEDGQVEDVKKAVKAPAKSEEVPKATVTAEAKEGTKAPAKTGEGTVKKKKSIIVVSNPNNSKMPGASQIPRKTAHTDKNAEKNIEKKAVPQQHTDSAKAVPQPAVEKPVQNKENIEIKVETEPVKTEPVKTEPVKMDEAPKTDAPKAAAQKNDSRDSQDNKNDNQRRDNNKNDKGFDRNGRNDGQRRDGQRRDGQGINGNRNGRNDGQRRDGQGFNGNRDNRDSRDNRGGFGGNRDNRNSDRNGRNDGQRRDGQGFNGNRDNRDSRDNRGGFGGNRDSRDNRGGFGGKNNKNSGFMPESPIKDAEKHRDEEKRRISQEKDKRNRKDLMYDDDDNGLKNGKGKNGNKQGNKAGKFIKPEKKPVEVVEEQIKVITIPETITIKDLADKMKIQPSAIVKKLFLQGQIVTVNQEVSYETAENIAIEYDIICEKEVKVDVIEELLREDEEKAEDMVSRPPVICVMGHVDHGKTSLLDAIRKTNVTDKEAGGITQHIGAYTVNINGQKITFLDTPGHEAFTAMRMRGANSTDIAILVVAADDGVMPQTIEAINHAKAAGIEIIVAVNKIDKPGANIERVKQELTEYGLIAEDWGGSTVFVPVSAKSGEGIETLLEMILLTAEVLELKANPNRRARGLVIEAELDKGRGPVATILVQKGTLKVGDFVSAGAASGKVRAMIDDKGRRVKEAGPSTPVEILGLGDVPNAGEIFIAHDNDKEAKYYAETFVAQNKEKLLEDTKAKMSLDDLFSQIQAGNLKELNLIIKADVQGSVEAVKQSLMKLSNEEVVVKCIHGGVGAINESDVILASASKAIIIGFNVRPDAQAKATAEREGVDVRLYKVIYQAIEDIEAAMKGMLDPVYEEKIIGHAEVRQIFRASAVGNIAGSYVLDGVFQRGCKVRITREGEQIYEGELASLKRFKDDVKEVKAGFECGLVFEGYDSMQELDIVEAYIMVEVPR
jgi:translation initiation factor IF-2